VTASDVLATLRDRGVEVFIADGKLRYRGPVGALDDDMRRVIAERRPELLAILSWDLEAANAELRQALDVIDAALSATWLTPSQRNVVGVFKLQVENYYFSHDPQLFGAAGWIKQHVEYWRAVQQTDLRR
jgi:hypothetical protein